MQSIDILYLTLSISVALLTIFISITLIYLMFILRDINKVSDSVKETVDKVNTYIAKPILFTKHLVEFVERLLPEKKRGR